MLVNIPEDVYSQLQAIADATAQPVEAVLVNQLKSSLPLTTLPPDEAAELAALHQLSDDALWTIAREQMPDDVQVRMETLLDQSLLGKVTSEEYSEMQSINQRADRLMMRKAEAAAILIERGHQFTQKDFKPSHE